jgi:hypothetical protein
MRFTRIAAIVGFICMLGFALSLIFTYFSIYATPEKEALIAINDYGEANIEIFLAVLGLLCMPFFAWQFFKGLFNPKCRYSDKCANYHPCYTCDKSQDEYNHTCFKAVKTDDSQLKSSRGLLTTVHKRLKA